MNQTRLGGTGRQSTWAAADSDLLGLYLNDIGRHDLLTREDEQHLGVAIEAGRAAATALAETEDLPKERRAHLEAVVRRGEDATETFLTANLRLVVSIARRYQHAGLAFLDLVQEGNLGLMHALEKFDFSKGFKFSTYATWWVRQSITRALANTGRTIRLPVHAGDTVTRVIRARDGLEGDLGRVPTLTELADETGFDEQKLAEILTMGAQPLSIFEPVGPEGDGSLGDFIEDPSSAAMLDEVLVSSLPDQILELLDVLDQRERNVVCLRYGLDRGVPRTLAEVAEACDMTKEGIRQVERRALAKLRLSSATTGMADLVAG